MKFLKKILASKEVKAALGVLDEAELSLDSGEWQLVRGRIENIILARPTDFTRVIQKGADPRVWVYSAIANFAGDCAESGEYHIYRGVLGPSGKTFLRIFRAAVDELTRLGNMDAEFAAKQKTAIWKNIETAG